MTTNSNTLASKVLAKFEAKGKTFKWNFYKTDLQGFKEDMDFEEFADDEDYDNTFEVKTVEAIEANIRGKFYTLDSEETLDDDDDNIEEASEIFNKFIQRATRQFKSIYKVEDEGIYLEVFVGKINGNRSVITLTHDMGAVHTIFSPKKFDPATAKVSS